MRTTLTILLAVLVGPALAKAAVLSYTFLGFDKYSHFQVQVDVTGGELVQGMNFYAIIGDGGTDLGGSCRGPAITGVSFAGSIWDGHNTGFPDTPLPLPNQYYATTTTTPSGTIALNGKLCTITLERGSFQNGIGSLALSLPSLGLYTTFENPNESIIPEDPTEGWLAPEPATLLLLGLGSVLVRRRMTRACRLGRQDASKTRDPLRRRQVGDTLV